MLVTASQEAGVLEEQEEQMLHRVFDFADMTAGQAMVPRTELVAVAADASGDALLEQISRGGYARPSGLPRRYGQRRRHSSRDRRRSRRWPPAGTTSTPARSRARR